MELYQIILAIIFTPVVLILGFKLLKIMMEPGDPNARPLLAPWTEEEKKKYPDAKLGDLIAPAAEVTKRVVTYTAGFVVGYTMGGKLFKKDKDSQE